MLKLCQKKGRLEGNEIKRRKIANCYLSVLQNLYVYFELFGPRRKLPFNWTKPGNNSLLRKPNIKEMILNHKGTRMVKDGEV